MGMDFAGYWRTRDGRLVLVLGWHEGGYWAGGEAGELVRDLAWDENGDAIGRPRGWDLATRVREGAAYK